MTSGSFRLDLYVAQERKITRSAAQKLICDGNVTVNGRIESKNYILRENDRVDIVMPEPEMSDIIPQDIPLDIVYEDDSLIVVNKPKGMVVHPAAGNYEGTLVNALLYRCGDSLSGINGVIRPGIVHRIDKNTSGLLVVAKNDTAHNFLAEQIKAHSFERTYHAVATGRLKELSGTVDAPIGRHPYERKKMAVVSGGREAVTHYRVLEELGPYSYVECRLMTGRTHQIRVHMKSIGHPLLGDDVYGNPKDPFCKKHPGLLAGQCLHAKTLGFIHPATKEFMRFDSELPDYFKAVLRLLRECEND